jgi:hypothetical protein
MYVLRQQGSRKRTGSRSNTGSQADRTVSNGDRALPRLSPSGFGRVRDSNVADFAPDAGLSGGREGAGTPSSNWRKARIWENGRAICRKPLEQQCEAPMAAQAAVGVFVSAATRLCQNFSSQAPTGIDPPTGTSIGAGLATAFRP